MTFRKGKPGFKDALEDFRKSYIDSWFPNLTGYAYQADMIDADEGKKVMRSILRKIEEIKPEGVYGHPEFRLRGERDWRSVVDTDDFPVPSDEPWNGEEEDGEPVTKPHRHPRTLFNERRR